MVAEWHHVNPNVFSEVNKNFIEVKNYQKLGGNFIQTAFILIFRLTLITVELSVLQMVTTANTTVVIHLESTFAPSKTMTSSDTWIAWVNLNWI